MSQDHARFVSTAEPWIGAKQSEERVITRFIEPVKRYWQWADRTASPAWCAAFALDILRESLELPRWNLVDYRRELPGHPFRWWLVSTSGIADAVKNKTLPLVQFVPKPEAGDLFLEIQGGRFRHTGIVRERLGDASIVTIEGNIKMKGVSQVVSLERRIASDLRFVRWTRGAP